MLKLQNLKQNLRQKMSLIIATSIGTLLIKYIFLQSGESSKDIISTIIFSSLTINVILVIYIIINHNNITMKKFIIFLAYLIVSVTIIKPLFAYIGLFLAFNALICTIFDLEDLVKMLPTWDTSYTSYSNRSNTNNSNNNSNNGNNNNNSQDNGLSSLEEREQREQREKNNITRNHPRRMFIKHINQPEEFDIRIEDIEHPIMYLRINKCMDTYHYWGPDKKIWELYRVKLNVDCAKEMEDLHVSTVAILKYEDFQLSPQSRAITQTDMFGNRHRGWKRRYVEEDNNLHPLPKIGGILESKQLVGSFILARIQSHREGPDY